jgi:hypothetical protein
MEIRSLTCFADLAYPLHPAQWRQIARFASEARRAFADEGFHVQSVRLATQPFPEILASAEAVPLAQLSVEVEAAAKDSGVSYVSLGPAPGSLGKAGWRPAEEIPEAIAATEGVFFGASIASAAHGADLQGIAAMASVIQRVSRGVANGFGNLRLAALANCGPWSPFFPVAYHGGGAFRFAVATEAADLAVSAFSEASSPAQAEELLTSLVQCEADRIVPVARRVAESLGIGFGGIDFSLAPYPTLEKSVGHAVEALTGGRFGARGTLFAAAMMTRAIQSADFPKVGFCGLMLPVLEDTVLSARSLEGAYSLDHLLLYSAVCGTGLDTVPLPGDTSHDELAAILADVGTLAARLNKPLTARLMPIPGKRAGERTEFDFEYFANAGILDVRGGAPGLWR